MQEPHFPWLTASGADSRSEVPESRRFGGARLRERLTALDEIDRGAARSRDLSLAAVRGSEGAGGSPPPTGTGGLPPPVPPTPTLSLLDRVSHCKPQAPRGFPTVIGSGQACLVLARGLGPPGRGDSGPVSLLPFRRPRGQSRSKPPAASRDRTAGPASSLGAQDWGFCLELPAARTHTCPKPEPSHLGTGSASRETQQQGRGPMGRLHSSLSERSWGRRPEGQSLRGWAAHMRLLGQQRLPRPVTPGACLSGPYTPQQLPRGCRAMGVAVSHHQTREAIVTLG